MSYRAKDNQRLHGIYKHTKERCYNPHNVAYDRYGGRGIGMCDEWKNDFTAFCQWALEHGYDAEAPRGSCTIDRIDNSKGYSPDNCRWVSMKEQARNRRNNRPIEAFGETHLAIEWAEIVGLKKTTLLRRLDLGWSIEDALTKPLRKRGQNVYV